MRVAVVGAGAVGLCTAWYLRDHGIDVTVFESANAGNGASWGNAGQVLPSKAVPLPEPGNLQFALKSFFKKNSPVTAPRQFDLNLLKFLSRFLANSTEIKFRSGRQSMWDISRVAFSEYTYMESSGLNTTRFQGPFTSAFKSKDSSKEMIIELREAREFFTNLQFDFLEQDSLLESEALLDERFTFGIQLQNQSYINPPQFLENLLSNLQSSKVEIFLNTKVTEVIKRGNSIVLKTHGGDSHIFDAVVIATGAWLNRLTQEHGVKLPVIAGIGYSLSVEVPAQTQGMLYLPESKLATTNYGAKLRISTFMQMANVEKPRDAKRTARLINLASLELPKANWETAGEFWSGGRPLSGDGKPLIGATSTSGVYVNSGHGMWGITLAPVSGRLIAEAIIGKNSIPKAFDPTR